MPPYDEFVHVSSSSGNNDVSGQFFEHSAGKRIFTEAPITAAIRKQYPKHHLTLSNAMQVDLIAFANAHQDAKYQLRSPSESLIDKHFLPPARRYNDEKGGAMAERIHFGCFDYFWKGNDFLVYMVEGRDGPQSINKYNYILVPPNTEDEEMTQEQKESAEKLVEELIEAATRWSQELHNEVLIFDNGYWQPNKDLYENIQKANWADVILDQEKKEAIIEDVLGFFDAEERYAEFEVPWKRGVIFYGPPGNGKTISTKALMHDLSQRTSPNVECLYVKTFKSFSGPEYGIRQIFLKARQMAPCLLIFEDIDSLVDVSVRSYFLNEVDGLESNHGILMIGSTNHLERLDPGIAKRPSRFDRKYLFDVPDRGERVQYCEYWRHKLRKNKKVDFPQELSQRIADLTDDFSFAYMKEAFVAALLVIVAKNPETRSARRSEDGLRDNLFWTEIKKQISSLRKEMEEESCKEDAPAESAKDNSSWPTLSAILDSEIFTERREQNWEQQWGQNRGHIVPRYNMPRYM